MRKPRPQPYAEAKPRPKTLKVICAACTKHYYHTITALPWEYKKVLEQTKCMNCKVTGKLATSDLAKARPRTRTDLQMSLTFEKRK